MVFVFVLLIAASGLHGQNPVARNYGDLIVPADLKENLSILASDAMEGRDTGKRGQKMAAAFIRAHFEELGLTGLVNGGYYQPVDLYASVPGDTYVKIGTTRVNNFEGVVFYGTSDSGGEVTVPVVFAGKGRKEDFDQVNVEGKAVVVMLGTGESARGPVSLARERKAKITFVYTADAEEFNVLEKQIKSYVGSGSLSVTKPEISSSGAGTFYTSPAVAAKIFNLSPEKLNAAATEDPTKLPLKKLKPASITYKTALAVKTVKSENVLGFLEGTDKKDEVLVVTAHYDHVGVLPGSGERDRINNGADDDGSGTVAVLQIAKAFAQAKKDGKGPRRSILFMLVTGEEKGLLGSDYYTQHPIIPLEKTVVDLNIDMVGRRDPQHKDSAPYVYVIGSDKLSTELHKLSETVNKTYTNLIFDYTYNDQDHPDRLYYRSDHWNFAKNNIPIIFYFDGIHEDYHLPSDEVSKIEFDLLAKRTQLVFFTAWEIANREQRIMPDQKNRGAANQH